jgi:hypothetical protein
MNTQRSTSKNFLGLPKLPARYGGIVLAILLSLLMTFIVSFISTLRGVGLAPGFVRIWLGAWGISWAVAFPTLLAVLPLARRATSALVSDV